MYALCYIIESYDINFHWIVKYSEKRQELEDHITKWFSKDDNYFIFETDSQLESRIVDESRTNIENITH